jgi:sRNA-binding carbon storage regulator CsrA
MLVQTRTKDEALIIYPADDLDPSMTVAELFQGGPIKIVVDKPVKLAIKAPTGLSVVREELEKACLVPRVS